MPKIVAVVGSKHSGKTTLLESLINHLTQRGNRVGTIKEMVQISTLDTPQKETDRYSKAGAEINVALPKEETVIFIKRRLHLKEIMPYIQNLDYVLLEGFESEKLPKIVAAKTAQEAQKYLDEYTFVISGIIANSKDEIQKLDGQVPIIDSFTDIEKIVDLIDGLR